MTKTELIGIIALCPPEFDQKCWSTGELTYREEMLLSALYSGAIDHYHAEQIAIGTFDGNPELIEYIKKYKKRKS